MALEIELRDPLLKRLQRKAEESQLSVEQLVLNILTNATRTHGVEIDTVEPAVIETEEDFPALEEVVAKINNTPPNPANFRPPTGSLAYHLRNAPDDPNFDVLPSNDDLA